ncbi:TetR/AcrR family transcriptional regulator, partial [Morganella morganii]|nr:TetR/AcrR family transcriptional regulator [Morganella morganii]
MLTDKELVAFVSDNVYGELMMAGRPREFDREEA